MAYKMVAHAAKFKRDNLKGARMHNERLTKQHGNKDIDVTRSYLNYSLVDRRPESYAKQVNRLLNSDRKPRKDAVYDVEFVFGSDGKYMLSLDAKQQRQYFQTCMDYVADKWGKDRILYADVHLDETSPHMHMGAAPVDQNGHLAAKNLFNRDFLLTMQAELPARLAAAGFDIERGNPGGVHTTKAQWEKVTKKANEQVISQLAENFPKGHHWLCDKNGKMLHETDRWGRESPRNSHAWGTPEGQKELRERSLDDNVSELTYATKRRVKTADKAVHEANVEKEQAKAQKAANDQYLATESARLHTAGIELDSRLSAVREREKKLEERKTKLAADAARVTRQKQEMNAVVAAGLPYVMGHGDDGRSNVDLFKSETFFRGSAINGRYAGYPSLFDAFVDGRFKVDGQTGAEHLFSHLQNVPVSQRARMQQDVNQARDKSRQTTETATAEPENDGPEL